MLRKTLFIIALFFQGEAFAAKSIPPPPQNYVYDEAGILTSSIGSLSSILSQEDRQFGNQILVAVFNSTEGEDPVDFTNRLFASWHPGEAKKDNGVLLAFYLKEKKIRIEVGYGLEPLMTDAKSKRVIVNIIGPSFRESKYNEGIINAVQEIQRIIHSEGTEPGSEQGRRGIKVNKLFFLFIFIIFFILKFIDRFTPQTLGSNGFRRGGGWGGGYGGGGSSGWGGGGDSGGFSGGGGSSGGGGASGDW
jgi:uncharacterized protein